MHQSICRGSLTRLALASVVLSGTALSFADGVVKLKSLPTRKSAPPVTVNTRDFFPQINPSFSQKRFAPRNPSNGYQWRAKAPTGWVGGGVGGNTTADRQALFPGISFTNSYPADPQIAVSKTHIVEVVNTDMAFYDKKGTLQFQTNLGPNDFFSGLNATPFTYDPKVFFDKTVNRFFVVILEEDDGGKTSHFLIAMSDDANPNGSWTKWRVDNEGSQNSTEAWLDYEGWGYNKDVVVTSGNMFGYGAGYAGYVQAFMFKKSEMLAGKPLTTYSWFDTSTFTIQCAKMDDKTVPYAYGVSLDDTSPSAACRVYAFRNVTTDTPELVYTSVKVPDFEFVGRPPSAGGAILDSLSGRLIDATYRSGSLLTCHTTKAASGSTRSAVTWYEFKPGSWPASGSPSLVQSGNVALPGDAWAFVPGIHKNSAGDITVLFTRSSSSIIADTMVASRKTADPKGQMGTPKMLSTSNATYRLSGRWGDYISVAVDPTDELTFWGVNMNSRSDGFWGTSIVSWKVSTSGGGGGFSGIKPDGVSVLEGSFSAGTLTNIQTEDGSTYNSNAIKKPDGSYATAVQTTYSITAAKNSVTAIDVRLKNFITPSRTPVGYVFLWNYDKNRWDYIQAFNLGGVNKVYTVTKNSGATAYVSTGKKVKVMIRALDPIRNNGYSPAPFKLNGDAVQIAVSTQ